MSFHLLIFLNFFQQLLYCLVYKLFMSLVELFISFYFLCCYKWYYFLIYSLLLMGRNENDFCIEIEFIY